MTSSKSSVMLMHGKDGEDLSLDQLKGILKDAEKRMQSNERNNFSQNEISNKHPSLSTLESSILIGPASGLPSPYFVSNKQGAQIDPECLVSTKERKLANDFRRVEASLPVRDKVSKEKKATAGSKWYNLPRTVLTPELKRDLQLLRMRGVIDPKRHYKKENDRKNDVPEFSQVGTIIEGPTEFFTARLTNKERKRTFTEEIMAGEKVTQRFKSKYNEIQQAKTSGKKAHYKALKVKRAQKNSKG